MNDDYLNRYRRPPRPEFAARLYERISQPMVTQPKRPAWRLAGLIASILAAVVITVLLFPSARAFASGIIQRIGGYGFTQDPAQVTSTHTAGPVGVLRTATSVSMPGADKVPNAPNAGGASQLAGFTVLAPSYLPAGYSAMSNWMVTPQESGLVASKGYRDAGNHFFVVNEWRAGSSATQYYARDVIVAVSIHGHAGVWLPDASAGAARKNALVWAENGITYSLITDSLPLDELAKVAEGLGK